MVVGSYLLTTDSPWRVGAWFALAQRLDHVQHFLPGEDAFALQQLYQGRGLPQGGDGQLVEGHEVVGVEGLDYRSYIVMPKIPALKMA